MDYDDFVEQEEDEETLKELKESKKDRSFAKVINKRRIDPFELDEAMV